MIEVGKPDFAASLAVSNRKSSEPGPRTTTGDVADKIAALQPIASDNSAASIFCDTVCGVVGHNVNLAESRAVTRALCEASSSSSSSDTNRKYEQDYCQHHLGSNDLDHRHCRAALALQPPVAQLGLGYDVLHGSRVGFACIAQRIAWHGSDNLGDESGTRTGSGCDDQAADPRLVQAMRQLILEDRELKQQDKGKLRLHARLGDAILGVGPIVLTKQTLGDYTWAHPEPQELTRPEQTTRGGSGARPAAR